MSRQSKLALVFGLILVLASITIAQAWAVTDNPYISNLFRTGSRPYSNQLTATVTTNLDGTYHYAYELIYDSAAFAGQLLTSFSVANDYDMPFTNQWCDYDFTAAQSDNSIYWYVNLPLGTTVNFSYDSPAFYDVVNSAMLAGLPAGGLTLGMVPEPGTVAALLFGLCGAMWAGIKRKRK